MTDRRNDVAIARATVADLDELVDMFEQYRQFDGRERRAVESRQFLQQRLTRRDSTIFIARRDSRFVAGFVQLYPCFSSLSIASIWILNDLYVKPEHRTAGIGRALLEAARRMGEETGASCLILETASDNLAARRLYESLGYTIEPPMVHYSLELTQRA
jgi:ribosomal protein S18 acetylase RimI-like enzyme